MDFKKSSIVLAMILLSALKISCQVSLIRDNFDPQDCIVEGTVVTLTCTVEDHNNGFGATIINGSQTIFNCPTLNTVENDRLYFRHSNKQSSKATCGDVVSGRTVEVRNGTYITQINIITKFAMNGGYVECREFGIQDSPQIQLANIKALPGHPTIYVKLFETMFLVLWNQSNEGLTQISNFSIDVTGDECGNCTNFDRIMSSVTNQLLCTGWEPNGQICNVTVTAITSVCGLWQFISSSRLVFLKVPDPPQLKDITPAYSFDLEELKSMQIFLAIESTVDSNGFPIMFEVNVKRSNSNNMTPKCSFKISAANSKCIANALVKYRCEINFTVSSCPQLQEQPQDADYQIGIFTENDIGKSSLNASNNIPSFAHLRVQFLFTEPQQSQEKYNFISISFPQIYDEVKSMIKYGPICQALDNQTTITGFNATTLTFLVPGTMDDICWIVTINNNSHSIVIEGISSLNSPADEYNYSISVVSVALSILFIMIFTPTVTWCIQKKYKNQANKNDPVLLCN